MASPHGPYGPYLGAPPPSVHTWVPKERYVPRWDHETLQTESLAGSSHSLLTCREREGGREGGGVEGRDGGREDGREGRMGEGGGGMEGRWGNSSHK